MYYPVDFENYNELIDDNNMPYNLNYDIKELKTANKILFENTWVMANEFHIETIVELLCSSLQFVFIRVLHLWNKYCVLIGQVRKILYSDWSVECDPQASPGWVVYLG